MPADGARRVPPAKVEGLVGLEGLEELGADAIIAQETQAHLPQKRVNVQDEARSVVISEEPAPSQRRPVASRAERLQRTIVLRDRTAVAGLRGGVPSRVPPAGGVSRYAWAGLTIAAFAIGGTVALLVARGMATKTSSDALTRALSEAAPVARPRPSVRASDQARTGDLARPPIQIEDLPRQARPQR